MASGSNPVGSNPVHSVGVTVPVGQPPVTQVGATFQTHLPPTASASPISPGTTIQLTPVDADVGPIFIFNRTLRLHTRPEDEAALQDVVSRTKAAILDHYRQKTGNVLDATKFTIHFDTQIFESKDRSGNRNDPLDIREMIQEQLDASRAVNAENEVSAIADLMEESKILIQKDAWKGRWPDQKYTPGEKGVRGQEALARKSAALYALPKAKTEARKAALDLLDEARKAAKKSLKEAQKLSDPVQESIAKERISALNNVNPEKRISALDSFITNITKTLQDQKTVLETKKLPLETSARATPPPPNLADLNRQIFEINQNIQKLDKEMRKFSELDYFALYAALAFYPDQEGSIDTIAKQAELLQNAIFDKVAAEEVNRHAWEKENHYAFTNVFGIVLRPILKFFGTTPNLRAAREFAFDAGGMLYAGLNSLDSRKGYLDYARKDPHSLLKEETLEESLLRMVVNPSGAHGRLEKLASDVSDDALKLQVKAGLAGAKVAAQVIMNQAPAPATPRSS